jgi:hypothetical protein
MEAIQKSFHISDCMHERMNVVFIPRMIIGEQNPSSEAEQNSGSYFAFTDLFLVLGPEL